MTDKVRKARDFATEAHEGQERKFQDLPFIAHPTGVFTILYEYGKASEDELAAAFLHDVLEDTDVTSSELEQEFEEGVVSIVNDLTVEKPASLDKNLYLKTELTSMPDSSLRVKLSDRLHNVSDLCLAPDDFSERYSEDTEKLIRYVQWHRDPLGPAQHDLCNRILHVLSL